MPVAPPLAIRYLSRAQVAASFAEIGLKAASVKNAAITVLASLGVAAITFALTVVMALDIAYVHLHGDRDPSWFAAVAWAFILGWPILVPALFAPSIVAGTIGGSVCKKRLNRIRLEDRS
jgi:hypothetical protein